MGDYSTTRGYENPWSAYEDNLFDTNDETYDVDLGVNRSDGEGDYLAPVITYAFCDVNDAADIVIGFKKSTTFHPVLRMPSGETAREWSGLEIQGPAGYSVVARVTGTSGAGAANEHSYVTACGHFVRART